MAGPASRPSHSPWCFAACAPPAEGPTPEPPVAGISSPQAAADAAIHFATIHGPLTVGDIKHGTYSDLFAGSTNDLSGAPGPDPNVEVWRVDVTGPGGAQQLYLDATTGLVVDSITQGQ